jgi:hypothetical protein
MRRTAWCAGIAAALGLAACRPPGDVPSPPPRPPDAFVQSFRDRMKALRDRVDVAATAWSTTIQPVYTGRAPDVARYRAAYRRYRSVLAAARRELAAMRPPQASGSAERVLVATRAHYAALYEGVERSYAAILLLFEREGRSPRAIASRVDAAAWEPLRRAEPTRRALTEAEDAFRAEHGVPVCEG